MVAAIIALFTALLVAVPVVWQWSRVRAVKKEKKELEKRKQEIRKAVDSGDIATVKRTLGKWL